MATGQDDALVLADSDGNFYMLPRELIELTKVEADAVDALNEQVESEVSGYAELASGFSFVGSVRLSPKQTYANFSPSVAWPYYRPGVGDGGSRINPAG